MKTTLDNRTTRKRLAEAVTNISPGSHVCLIYSNHAEQFAAAIPYIQAGLERGEQSIYIVDDNTAAEVEGQFAEHGVAVKSEVAAGNLVIANKRDSYLREGSFDPDGMIDFLEQSTDNAAAAGYEALRVTGEMTWALGPQTSSDELLEYEAKLNTFFPGSKASAICQYSLERFPAEIIRDVLYTHPQAIVGGVVCKNFYYKPPDEYLAKDSHAEVEVRRMIDNIYDFERRELELLEIQHLLQEANRQLEDKVQERTQHLEEQATELRRLNANMVGREYRIRELEAEARRLNSRIDQLLGLLDQTLE